MGYTCLNLNLYKGERNDQSFKKAMGGALLVSLLALSLALAGCSEPEAVGSDITGTWTNTSAGIACTFYSDGTCILVYTDTSSSPSYSIPMNGSWSLNGTTVGIDASFSDSSSGIDLSVSLTCTYNNDTEMLALKSISATGTAEGQEIDIEYEDDILAMITLQKSTN